MRLGWYLLIYAGAVGIVGTAQNILHIEIVRRMGFGSTLHIDLSGFLLTFLPLLSAPIGVLILRRSEWLPLSLWVYLGFAIPTAVGGGYLLWQQVASFRMSIVGGAIYTTSVVEGFLYSLSRVAGNYWFAWVVALCAVQSPPEKLTRFWRKGIGVFLLLWGLLMLSPLVLHYWLGDTAQSGSDWRVYARAALISLDALVWLTLGGCLLRGKGWLPATAAAIVMKIALYVAHQLFGWGMRVSVSGWSGALPTTWIGWHDPIVLTEWLSGMLYSALLDVAPLVLMLTVLGMAFPHRLAHYGALWRLFRRQRLERMRL